MPTTIVWFYKKKKNSIGCLKTKILAIQKFLLIYFLINFIMIWWKSTSSICIPIRVSTFSFFKPIFSINKLVILTTVYPEYPHRSMVIWTVVYPNYSQKSIQSFYLGVYDSWITMFNGQHKSTMCYHVHACT